MKSWLDCMRPGGLLLLSALGVALGSVLGAVQGNAQDLAPEQLFVESLGEPTSHWVLVNDSVYALTDTRAYLLDADSGAMLGMISTGAWRNAVEFAPGFAAIYSPETYYSRGSRGTRTDVLTIYDTATLDVTGEIVIPPKRAAGMPHRAYSGISDDGRFVYVANMTPATSISVVDVKTKHVQEIATAGCALTYPAGNRTFLMLCGNGTVQRVTLDENGHLESRAHTEPFFDPEADPLTEKAARHGDTWLFVSFNGQIHPVRVRNDRAKPQRGFSLFSDAERGAGWQVGGLQFTVVHQASGRLFVIVHQGEAGGHKDPGEQVWVYDVAKRKKIAELALVAPAKSIAVSADDAPLLYAVEGATPALLVYDANSGEHLRTIEGPPFNPGLLQPVVP